MAKHKSRHKTKSDDGWNKFAPKRDFLGLVPSPVAAVHERSHDERPKTKTAEQQHRAIVAVEDQMAARPQ